jgi:crotonobetainyl-CoA:carnitine CoA-transferase CaiB-like acyl-CoA transferase
MFYKALDGAKVVEYGTLVSGPFCAKILADLGAEVIKIEQPGCGDPARKKEPFLNDSPGLEHSGLFQYLNMNKLGVTLNPEMATGKKIFTELLKNADIFVENNPPARMKELELAYKQVKQINPHIIMTSITPFGQTGPYKNYVGCELVNTHMGGVGYISTREGNTGKEPIKYPAHFFGFQAGLSAAAVTLGDFYRQCATGLGSHLDVSEQESIIQNINSALANYWYGNQVVSRTDVLSIAPAHILPCKDGYIYNAFAEERQWWRFVEVMGHPEWADIELFKDASTRAKYWDALKPLLLEWTMEHTTEEIYRWSQEQGAPVGAVRTADQVVNDRQMAAREFFVEVENQENVKLKYPGVPYSFSEIQRQEPMAAPGLGQHNEDIYCGRLGYSPREVARLKEAGVI